MNVIFKPETETAKLADEFQNTEAVICLINTLYGILGRKIVFSHCHTIYFSLCIRRRNKVFLHQTDTGVFVGFSHRHFKAFDTPPRKHRSNMSACDFVFPQILAVGFMLVLRQVSIVSNYKNILRHADISVNLAVCKGQLNISHISDTFRKLNTAVGLENILQCEIRININSHSSSLKYQRIVVKINLQIGYIFLRTVFNLIFSHKELKKAAFRCI